LNLNDTFLAGLTGLITHKLRSVLTALGIIFGVAAVIAMLSIGEAIEESSLKAMDWRFQGR
jgi:putative ABC transport system permease protein